MYADKPIRGLRIESLNSINCDLQRVITVSLETMKLVNNLPKLDIDCATAMMRKVTMGWLD